MYLRVSPPKAYPVPVQSLTRISDRKQSHDKIYPAGYTGHLERDQVKLVSALQKMYKILQNAQVWPGPPLEERAGRPLTHDLLIALGVLTSKDDSPGDVDYFEEDYEKLKAKLLAEGAGYVQRRASSSSMSEHSHHDAVQPAPLLEPAANDSIPPTFKENFDFRSASPSTFSQHLNQQRVQSFPAPQPSPLQHSAHYTNDPQFYAAEWSIPDMSTSHQTIQSQFTIQNPANHSATVSHMQDVYTNNQYDGSMTWNTTSFDGNAMIRGFPQQTPSTNNSSEMDYCGFDPAEIEFHKYVQCNS